MSKSKKKGNKQLADDMIIVTLDSDTTCNICCAEFLDTTDLKTHVEYVHLNDNNKARYCRFCSLLFSNMEDFVVHLRDCHLCTLKCCLYCTRAFTDMDLLRKHQSKHYNFVRKSMYACSHCKTLYNNIKELEDHEKELHCDSQAEGLSMFLNDSCLSLLSSVVNIKAIKMLQSCDEMLYICARCTFTTYKLEDYVSHLKTENCRSFVCDSCSKVYKSKRGLIKHYISSNQCSNKKTQDPVVCKGCNKCFDKRTYNRHKLNCKIYECQPCDLVFVSLLELSHHQAEQHSQTIPIVFCKYCRREYVGKVALKKHLARTHKNELHLYKYVCPYCEDFFGFKHPSKLFGHYASTHKDLEPYLCKICDQKFKFRKKFSLHIKLQHKSVGFVDYDEKFNVTFTDKKPDRINLSQQKADDNEINAEAVAKSVNPMNEDYPQKDKPKKQVTINLDYLSESETDCPTDTETNEPKQTKTRKRKITKMKAFSDTDFETTANSECLSSEDESLFKVKKKLKVNNKKKKREYNAYRRGLVINDNKKRFICNICKRNCNNMHSYYQHLSLHFKKDPKKCVKCSIIFNTQKELSEHIASEHQSSKLTETLKRLLEKRKDNSNSSNIPSKGVNQSLLFKRTIKKVNINESCIPATIRKVGTDNLSAKIFLESFAPDEGKGTNININTCVTIKPVTGNIERQPVINLTKFKPAPIIPSKPKLSMPVKFKKCDEPSQKAIIRMVNGGQPVTYLNLGIKDDTDYEPQFETNDYYEEEEVNSVDNSKEPAIPEVAQEVMLEGTEMRTNMCPKIIMPEVPEAYHQIKIAHLTQEAPYFKIISVKEVIKNTEEEKEREQVINVHKKSNSPVVLPSGLKLVNVNPLAHLLENKDVDLSSHKNKYYSPKMTNVAASIAKALQKLESQDTKKVKKAKRKNTKKPVAT